MSENAGQRLDLWLWCAHFARQRSTCADIAASGLVRINRQPTGKCHARVRVGDVLTIPVSGSARVVRVRALAARRGPAEGARRLYEEIA